jgi:hypothetical protein
MKGWAKRRKDPNASMRWVAVREDRMAGRDLTWARKDPDATVRQVVAYADGEARRDMAWARTDPDAGVRRAARWADYLRGLRLTGQLGGNGFPVTAAMAEVHRQLGSVWGLQRRLGFVRTSPVLEAALRQYHSDRRVKESHADEPNL